LGITDQGNDAPVSAIQQRAMTIGESALTGWRGRMGKALARPVAARTRFSEEQVRAILGLLLLAFVAWRTLRPVLGARRV
jgi:hypothetical protein